MGAKNTKMSQKDLVNVAGASGVALNGFDPVSFFTEKEPTNGNFKISTMHKGASYYFASEENKKTFLGNPDKYAPQHGGFCTFGVSVGALFPVDITCATVYKGKLYLNLNSDIVKMFEEDKDGAIAKADKNFPGLAAKALA